jgi:hypothetical protein
MTDQTAAALAAAKQAQQHGIDLSKLPQMMDLSPDSITDNVVAINSGCPDERMKFIMERTVRLWWMCRASQFTLTTPVQHRSDISMTLFERHL